MKIYLLKIIVLLVLTASNLLADVSGKVIAYACYSCHAEHLANLKLKQPLSTAHLSSTLLAFKANKQNSAIMNRITKGFTDDELKAAASYISETD